MSEFNPDEIAELNPILAPGDDSGREPSGGVLTIKQINIGQGNLAYIICPNGKRILIDAGSDNMGRRTMEEVAGDLEYAQVFTMAGSSWKNARRETNFLYVDLIILTHADKDHYCKIPDLVGRSPVQQIYVGGMVKDYKMPGFREWYPNAAVETKIDEATGKTVERIQQISVNSDQPDPVLLCDGGTDMFGNTCKIWAIASSVPPKSESKDKKNPNANTDTKSNANSLVVKIMYGNTSAMLTGDATQSTEDFIVANAVNYPAIPLASNLLLVPHHGSLGSSTPAFVQAVSPQIAVVSAMVGGNDHGLPRKEIIERYTTPVMLAPDNLDAHEIATCTLQDVIDPITTTKNIWQTGVSGTKSYILDGETVTPD